MNLNPFAEGNILGPPRRQSNKPAGAPVDPNSYLYPGSEPAGPSPTPDQSPTMTIWIPALGNIEVPNPNYVPGAPGQTGLQVFTGETQGIASRYGGELEKTGQGLVDTGTGLVQQGGTALAQDPNRLVFNPSIGGTQTAAQGASDAGAALMGLAGEQNGESAAAAQLRSGVAQAENQNLALAASGRGLGGGAAARRAAMTQNAQLFGQMNPALAALHAQETQADLQRRGQAASAAAAAQGTAGQLQLGLGGYVSGARGQGESLATERGLGLTTAGVGAMGTGAQALGTGAQTELTGQQIVGGANEAQLQARVAGEQNATQRRGQDRGLQGQEMAAEAQNKAGLYGAIGTLGSAAIAASDRRAKTDIEPTTVRVGATGGQPLTQAEQFKRYMLGELDDAGREGTDFENEDRHLAFGEPLHAASYPIPQQPPSWMYRGAEREPGPDEFAGPDGKIYPLTTTPRRGSATNSWVGGTKLMVRDPDKAGRLKPADEPSPEAATETVRQTPAYSFRYKDPERHGEGERVGVMAQDLEKTPAGARTVTRAPDGTRMVDTGELSTVNTAALHGVDQRVSSLEEELRKMREQFGFTPPAPDTGALDEAARRERGFGY